MDKDSYSKFRASGRENMTEVWRAYKAGEPLSAEDGRLAKHMAAHPEWHHLWEAGADFGGEEIVSHEGISPFGAVAIAAAVEGMIGRGGDKHARRAYKQLCRSGLSEQDARDEIARVFIGVYWEIGTNKLPADEGMPRFHGLLHRLGVGETAGEFWPEG